jgi:hypothetical protein
MVKTATCGLFFLLVLGAQLTLIEIHCRLQHTATHYNTLQHTATHCNTALYCLILVLKYSAVQRMGQHNAVLQCIAVCCIVLQCIAVHHSLCC